VQNYLRHEDGNVTWRDNQNIPPAARFISSPYDLDVRYARKHSIQWVGYKVHLTETCDDETPSLITHVLTTTAPVDDSKATAAIHAALETRGVPAPPPYRRYGLCRCRTARDQPARLCY
jgi:transposase